MKVDRRDLWRLFFLSLAVRLLLAAVITRPGYMDVAYYAAGAVQLGRGGGLEEPFLWNYLDDPTGIPHPGYLYWMPLPSLLGAPFAALSSRFFVIQLPFALLSALLPLVAYALAWEVAGRRRTAWLAGLLTLFSGFFFPYWSLPETFAPFALFGSLALWLAARRQSGWARALAGCLVGLAHLTRADGILLLPVVLLAPLLPGRSPGERRGLSGFVRHTLLVVLGYLLAMGPWFLRNLRLIGSPLAPGGTRTLWLTTYDDLFCAGCDLSLRAYLDWGWAEILRSKLWALGVNAERFLAENCLVFLLPFVLVGLYRLRRRAPFILSMVFLLLIYLAHSLAFTFPGPRGGFFHASAALLPFLFAAASEGLEAVVGWAARKRRWKTKQAQAVFAGAAVVAAVALSAYVAAAKVPAWREADATYREAGRLLAERGDEDAVVMVGNPPAFWYHTDHPAVVVPNGDVETLLAVADRYGVDYVLVDRNRPVLLAALHAGEVSHPRLQPVETWGEGVDRVVLFAVEP